MSQPSLKVVSENAGPADQVAAAPGLAERIAKMKTELTAMTDEQIRSMWNGLEAAQRLCAEVAAADTSRAGVKEFARSMMTKLDCDIGVLRGLMSRQ